MSSDIKPTDSELGVAGMQSSKSSDNSSKLGMLIFKNIISW